MKKTDYFFSLYFGLIDKMYLQTLTVELEFTQLDRYFIILWIIEESEQNKNPISQQNIADLLKIDKAGMVRIISFLVKKDYIIRERGTDKRSYVLLLTRKGKKTVTAIGESIENMNNEAMMGFSEEEKKQFIYLLQKSYKNLSNNPESDFLLKFLENLD